MLEYLTGIRETDTSIYKLDNIVQFVCAVVCVFVCVYAEASLRVQFGGCSINGDCLCILCNVNMPRRVYACNLVVAQSTETAFASFKEPLP